MPESPHRSKITIDTNILRYWIGNPINTIVTPQYMDKLSSIYNIYLTSISLAEIAEQEKEYPGLFSKCMDLYNKGKIRDFITIRHLKITPDCINVCVQKKDYTNLTNYLIQSKDECIKEFIRFFLFLYLFAFIKMKVIDNKSIDSITKNNAEKSAYDISRYLITKENKEINQQINDVYDDFTKKFFKISLNSFLIIWKIHYYKITKNINISEYNDKEEYYKFMISDPIFKVIDLNMQDPMKNITKKNSRDSNILQYIKDAFNSSEEKVIPDIALQYLLGIMERSIQNGFTIALNDIMDMLILYSFNEVDTLLTADKKIISFMDRINHPSSLVSNKKTA